MQLGSRADRCIRLLKLEQPNFTTRLSKRADHRVQSSEVNPKSAMQRPRGRQTVAM